MEHIEPDRPIAMFNQGTCKLCGTLVQGTYEQVHADWHKKIDRGADFQNFLGILKEFIVVQVHEQLTQALGERDEPKKIEIQFKVVE